MTDNITRLGLLRTLTIQDFNAEGFEVGYFEQEVIIETSMLMVAEDKRALIIKQISSYLANAIQTTTVPSHLWVFETDPRICKRIPSFPAVMHFGQ